jgi:hypothetical protein
VDVDSWRELLTRWNAELLDTPDIVERLPADVVASGWLGYPGATEEQISAAEARFGRSLPRSYRSFLRVSNGWRRLDIFHWHLWSTDEIDWFRVRNQDWIDAYVCYLDPDEWDGPHSVPDDEYFNYGTPPYGQNQGMARIEYLPSMLEISDIGDSAILLLNPEIVSCDGEWEAWEFATWAVTPTRYRSFWEMMQALHSIFLHMQESKKD